MNGNSSLCHEFETILNAAQALSYAEDTTFFLYIGSGGKQAWIMREVSERALKNGGF
jgi:hypothetical protein